MTLPTRSLQINDTQLSALGLGAWAIGGLGWEHAWGAQDDDDSIATIRRAVELGVTWIDTAPVYGHGHSEEVIGQALADLPEGDRPLVFTKAGVLWNNQDHYAPPTRDLRRLRSQVEDSLRRLGTDRIDLLQAHCPPDLGPGLEDYWGQLVALREDGMVGAVGLSNHDVRHLEVAERIGHVDTLQPPMSLLRRDAGTDLLRWCSEHGTGVICYSPLESGLLSGGYSAERINQLPHDDWRRGSAQFEGEPLNRTLRLVDALRPIADRHAVTVSAIAIAWVLAWPGVTAAIVGARRPDQVENWPATARVHLDSSDLSDIAAALEITGAGSGPTRPPG